MTSRSSHSTPKNSASSSTRLQRSGSVSGSSATWLRRHESSTLKASGSRSRYISRDSLAGAHSWEKSEAKYVHELVSVEMVDLKRVPPTSSTTQS